MFGSSDIGRISGSCSNMSRTKQYVFSEAFPVRRGVVQGDITFPMYFIIELEAILRKYDIFPDKGVDFGETRLHTLGYADDATLIDNSVEMASALVSSIAKGSKELADMEINIDKTECIHVKRQQKVAAPDQEEASKVCEHKCKNLGCDWNFGNKLGLRIHQALWCQWQNYYKVEKILDHRCEVYPAELDK